MALDPQYATRGKRTITRTLDVLVRKADPEFERERALEVEYRFSNGRERKANRKTRGAYTPD